MGKNIMWPEPLIQHDPFCCWGQGSREAPHTPSPTLQAALRECFDLQVSVSQINRVRVALGANNHSKQSPQEKTLESGASSSHLEWQEGAGSLLLLAATYETNLLACLETALTSNLLTADSSPRIVPKPARWTSSLWEKGAQMRENPVSVFYVDGHRKTVYADALIPITVVLKIGTT